MNNKFYCCFGLSLLLMLLMISSIAFAEREGVMYFKGNDLYKYSVKDKRPKFLYQGVRIKDEQDLLGDEPSYDLLEDFVFWNKDGAMPCSRSNIMSRAKPV
ncbi:MAG: hypothetical protein Q4D77_04835 [Peptostreptococcaceae bacterium]|nr:hypothetical protein [Peptostreptococcaceae bacterium]